MKKIMLFHLNRCPYCTEVLIWMDELKHEQAEYEPLEIELIEESENENFANQFDYYYVPTYYVGDEKVHEGAASKKIVESVFKLALKD